MFFRKHKIHLPSKWGTPKEREKKLKKTISRILLALLLAGILAFIISVQPSRAQSTKVSINPPEVTMRFGREASVNITLTNVGSPGIYSFEFKIYYNNTLLNATSAQIPEDQLLKPSKPGNIFIVDPGTINQDQGFVSFAATLLRDESGKTGSGPLATVTFKSFARGNGTLEIRDLTLVDPNATPIPQSEYSVENGLVAVDGAGGDINGDGEINLPDIVLAAMAFGSSPEHPRWDPVADLNKDGVVDIRDLVAIAVLWNNALAE
jgi:hypothetical protein